MKRTVVEVEVDEVGPSLRYATAKVNKASRGGGGRGGGGSPGSSGGGGGSAPPTTLGAMRRIGFRLAGGDDEPPF